MLKLITFLFVTLITSTALASGLKTSAGFENYESIAQSSSMCSYYYTGPTQTSCICTGSVETKRSNTLRIGVGYEVDMTERYFAEVGVGINTLTNGSAELNAGYKINDKLKAKAGLNISKDLNNRVIMNAKSGLGVQIGAEYKLNDRLSLYGTVGTKSQSYEISYVPGETYTHTSVNGNVGVTFSF